MLIVLVFPAIVCTSVQFATITVVEAELEQPVVLFVKVYTGTNVPGFAILNKLPVIDEPLYAPPGGKPVNEILPLPAQIVDAPAVKLTLGKGLTPRDTVVV